MTRVTDDPLNKIKKKSESAQQGSENRVSIQFVRLVSDVDNTAPQELVLTGSLWWLGVHIAKQRASSSQVFAIPSAHKATSSQPGSASFLR